MGSGGTVLSIEKTKGQNSRASVPFQVRSICLICKYVYVQKYKIKHIQLANAKLTGTKNAPDGLILGLRP